MTLCLFLGAGIILHKCKTTHFDGLRGLFTRMPLTMTGFFMGFFNHRSSSHLWFFQQVVFDHWWNGIGTMGVYDRADVLNHGDGGPFLPFDRKDSSRR